MNRQFDHKAIRIMIGVVAILIAPACLLVGGEGVLLSISSYYWSDAQDVFVGFLIAAGFLLYTYNGSGNGRDCEYFMSKFAGVFAVFVALFPTETDQGEGSAPAWVEGFSKGIGLSTHMIHLGSAVLLFVCLIIIMLKISSRAKSVGKQRRATVYKSIATLMAVGILVIFLVGKLADWDHYVLALEIWGLVLFGGGWILAGWYKTESLQTPSKAN